MYYHYITLKGIDKTKTEKIANNTVQTIARTCGWAKMHIWPSKFSVSPKNAPQRDNNCCVYRQG